MDPDMDPTLPQLPRSTPLTVNTTKRRAQRLNWRAKIGAFFNNRSAGITRACVVDSDLPTIAQNRK